MQKLVLIIGSNGFATLESSYARAFQALGWGVQFWNPSEALYKTVVGYRLGRIFSTFVPIEPWIRRANREMVLTAIDLQPDLIATFGNQPVRSGALAQIRIATSAAIVHIWPDTLLNWNSELTACLPLYDLLATYSARTIPILRRLGAEKIAWVPLAGDPFMHKADAIGTADQRKYECDIAFIGGWRPEREAILSHLGRFDLKIWGPDWGRRCRRNLVIMRTWQGREVRGREFAKAVGCAKVNLNMIDPTNYPAANMRFFEIPMAGGLQIASACPEMADEFRDEDEIFYYKDPDHLISLIQDLLEHDTLRQRVADAGHTKVLAQHTYIDRARQILENCLCRQTTSTTS